MSGTQLIITGVNWTIRILIKFTLYMAAFFLLKEAGFTMENWIMMFVVLMGLGAASSYYNKRSSEKLVARQNLKLGTSLEDSEGKADFTERMKSSRYFYDALDVTEEEFESRINFMRNYAGDLARLQAAVNDLSDSPYRGEAITALENHQIIHEEISQWLSDLELRIKRLESLQVENSRQKESLDFLVDYNERKVITDGELERMRKPAHSD